MSSAYRTRSPDACTSHRESDSHHSVNTTPLLSHIMNAAADARILEQCVHTLRVNSAPSTRAVVCLALPPGTPQAVNALNSDSAHTLERGGVELAQPCSTRGPLLQCSVIASGRIYSRVSPPPPHPSTSCDKQRLPIVTDVPCWRPLERAGDAVDDPEAVD